MDLKGRLFFALIIVGILTYKIVAERPTFCHLSAVVGPCRAMMTRYSYNPTVDKCQEFIYGGCKGNKNNFINLAECEETCKNQN